MDFRPYAPGDEGAIIELSKLTFPHLNLSLTDWRWRYMENPAGPAVIMLAWDGVQLVGHYALSPAALTYGGEPLRAIQSMLTMTHPDYRGRGIFANMARQAYAKAAADGFGLLFGFPNRASHQGFLRKLGWYTMYEIPMLRLNLEGADWSGIDEIITGVSVFPHTVDALWNGLSLDFPLAIAKTAAYLNWRYGSYKYTRLVHFADNRTLSAIDGLLVAKQYQTECQVVCLLCQNADIGLALIQAAARQYQYSAYLSVRSVSLWQNPNTPLHCRLEKQGFVNGEPVMYFGGLALIPGLPIPWRAYANWHMEMGDNDVF